MPVPMNAMYFMPPISGMKLPMPYPSASMYSSGSAILPSTDARASLRQTRRLRRQTGIQRSDRSGVRSSDAEYMQRRTNYLASITRTPDTGRRARRLGKEYRLRPAPPGKNFCLRARDRPEEPAVMSEAAVSNDE